jgi:putative heme-binding domain-containing protein
MNSPRQLLFLFALLCLTTTARAQTTQHGLRVPDGFEVTEFAGSDLANDIYCLTLDPKGRVVVSGRDYIRLLLDERDTGRATRVLDFAGAPKDGAMGLFWEGDDLYCMGDGGLRRYRDAGGEGRNKPPEMLAPFRTGGEHAAHAIRRGPDGWLYVLCGNNTGINSSNATLPTSPIRDPVAGYMLRFSPDFKGCEIVADGFRNAYGFDFNGDGEWFTYDSDNERCVSLPWYEGTRLYHVVPGGHYGWLNPQHALMWRLPPYFADVVAPLKDLGRGSPTGVVCYRHVQFPEQYRGGLFLLDWTFGRIWFVKLTHSGSTYKAEPQLFLEATGENGFAPTAAAVHPQTGDLYLSIGGRGTRGAVYRIRHPEGLKRMHAADAARLQPAPRSLEWSADLAKTLPRLASGPDLLRRREALVLMRRHLEHFEAGQLRKACMNNCDADDRLLCQAAAALFAALDGKERQQLVDDLGRFPWMLTQALLARSDPDTAFSVAAPLLRTTDLSPRVRLDAVRLVQRALGDLTDPKSKGTVWEGYSRRRETPALPGHVRHLLRISFPSKDPDLDRELARTFAMIEFDDPLTLVKVAERLRPDSDPVDDLHYLTVIARMKGERSAEVTRRVTDSLLSLDRKLTARKMNRESNWPLCVGQLLAELLRKDDKLAVAVLDHPEFGRPDHAFFAQAPGFDRRRAAEVFVERAKKDEHFAWNAAVVELVGELTPEKSLPVLRGVWGEHGLDETILPILAKHPEESDRPRFVRSLASAQPATVLLALTALEALPKRDERDETLALVLALRRLPPGKEEDRIAARLAAHLESTTGQKHGTDRDAWSAWLARKHPDLAKRLAGPDGVDVAAWEKRLAAIDWNAGSAERGRATFTKASCAACHSGAQALGPDLRGVAGRFSRADLFTAIIQPSKDVSPRYRTTQITTADGKTYQGIIVYEAVDSVILQTGPAATMRLVNRQIADRRLTANSLMPAGLIDPLTDQEIADLYAFLKELRQ